MDEDPPKRWQSYEELAEAFAESGLAGNPAIIAELEANYLRAAVTLPDAARDFMTRPVFDTLPADQRERIERTAKRGLN